MASVIGVNNEDYIVVNKNVSIKRSEFKDVTKKMQYVWVCIIKELMDDVGILVATSESDIKHEHKSFLQLCEGENGEVIDGNWLNSKLKVEKQTIKEKGINNSENTTGFEYSSTGWIRLRMNPDKDPMRNGYMAAPYYMKGHKESLLIPTISCSGIESRTIINLFSTGSYIGGFILVPKQGPLAGRVFGLRDSSFVAGFDMRAFPKYLSSGTPEQREKLEKAARNEVKPSDKPIKKDIIEVYRRLNQKKDVQEQSKKPQQPQNIEKETPVKKKATESNLLLGGLSKVIKTPATDDKIYIGEGVSVKASDFKDVVKKNVNVWICVTSEILDSNGKFMVAYNRKEICYEDKSLLFDKYELENGEPITNEWLNSKMQTKSLNYFTDNSGKTESRLTTCTTTGWFKARLKSDRDPMKNGYKAVALYKSCVKKERILIPMLGGNDDLRGLINVGSKSTDNYIGQFVLIPKVGPFADKAVGMDASVFTKIFDMRAFPDYFKQSTDDAKNKLENKISTLETAPSYRELINELSKLPKTTEEPEVKEKKSRSKHYNIVGRYCENGVQIVAWELQATDESRSFICAKDTLAFLVGKGLVDNCKGVGIRGYKTLEDGTREAQGAYFIGKDCNLASLPVFDNVTKKFRNTDGVGHVRRDDTATSVMNKVLLIGVVKHGRVIDGYVAKNSAGAKRFLSREEVIRRAKEGKIGNARVQQYNGRDLLRSIKGQGELESLPLMDKDGNLVEV